MYYNHNYDNPKLAFFSFPFISKNADINDTSENNIIFVISYYLL